jgi:16S rRNA processing protein RimM
VSRQKDDPDAEDLVEVGIVVKPWGIRGEVKIRVTSDLPGRFHGLSEIWLYGTTGDPLRYRIETVKDLKGAVAVRLAGIASPEQAETLRGATAGVPASERPALEEGSWYIDELVGLEVVDEAGRGIGTLKSVWQGAAQDVFEIATADGPLLLPAVAAFIRKVDRQAGRIVARIPPGEGETPEDRAGQG